MTDDTSIDIIVQSKFPKILDEFKEGFYETTTNFSNLRLHVIDGKEYGSIPINAIIKNQVIKEKRKYVGVFNDDLWFVNGWLEDCVELLKLYECVSAGYVETNDKKYFHQIAEKTKFETGIIDNLYGANYIFRTSIFKRIGIFDEHMGWSCEDLDWTWRFKLNDMKSVTSRKIMMAHIRYMSLPISQERNESGLAGKTEFFEKHGYVSYHEMKKSYRAHTNYFGKYKKYI